MSVLQLEKSHHAYDTHEVVRNVSFAAEPGELTCLLGPSGCGKTTLLRIAAGLERLQRGRITLADQVIGDSTLGIDLPAEKRGIGMMFQDYALFPHLTLFQNITFGIPAQRKDRTDWASAALEQLGLAGMADKYPHTLSGGQQQRAALLRAIAPEPRVLLLDEPFSGLDITLRVQVREEFLGFLKDTGVTTVMVTHDPEEAMFMADRVMVMEHGKILQTAAPPEIYFRPVNEYVAGLFGPINRICGTVKNGAVDTLVGRFATDGIAEGTAVVVLIRTEAVSVTEAQHQPTDGNVLTVLSARILGRSTYLRLRCEQCDSKDAIELHARLRGVFAPAVGTAVEIGIDRSQTFIFPER